MAKRRTPDATRRTGRKRTAARTKAKKPVNAAAPQPGVRGEVPRVRGTGPVASPQRAGLTMAAGRVSVAAPTTARMIILPRRGLRAEGTGLETTTVNALFALRNVMGRGRVKLSSVVDNVGLAASPALAGGATLKVIDSIAENGAKLVEMNPGDEAAVRAALPGLRLVPEVFYQPMSLRLSLESDLQPTGAAATIKVKVQSTADGKPVRDVRVIGFTNFALRLGAEAFANSSGVASLKFGSKPAKIERLYVFAERGFWSQLRQSVSTTGQIVVALDPIDLSKKDVLRTIYGETGLTLGSGVKVGVIDTGSGPHPQLVIAGGFNAVTGQNASDFGDNGDMHGTHVAGIIAARGSAPTGVRGLAPGVSLFSYRVCFRRARTPRISISPRRSTARGRTAAI